MGVYYTIHLIAVAACGFEFLKDYKLKIRIIKVLMLMFILFGGLRWNVGNDWAQYYNLFNLCDFEHIFNFDRYGNGGESLEPGFVFANALIKNIFGEFYIYNILLQFFIQLTYLKFSEQYSPKYPILLYAFIMSIRPNYFAVRAGFAICICFWAYRYIREKDLKKFLLVVILGSSVHYQCLIFFPFYFAGKIKMNIWLYLAIFWSFAIVGTVYQTYFVNFALMLSGGGDVADKLSFYSSYMGDSHKGAQFFGYFTNFFFIVNFFYIRRMKHLEKDEWYNALLNMNLVYNACLMVFADGMGELVRLAIVFFPAYAILMVNAATSYFNSHSKLIRAGSAAFFIFYLLYKIPQQFAGYYFEMTCLPYKTIFDYHILN